MRTISEETKAKMAEGRRRAAAEGRMGGRRKRQKGVTAEQKVVTIEEMAQDAVESPYELPSPEDADDFAPYELSASEKAEIEAMVKKRMRDDQRKAAKEAYMKRLIEQGRMSAGEITEAEHLKKYNEEEVSLLIRMPRARKAKGGRLEPEPIIIDGKFFQHGRSAKMPRAQAVYLMSLIDNVFRQQREADGDSMVAFDQGTYQTTYQGGSPLGGGGGPSFDAIHRRPARG